MTSNIRNFAIVAHVDHGKSTLADRLLEMTGTISKRDMTEQVLDSNPIEKERGITIKLAPVRMLWHPQARSSKHEIRNKLEIKDSNDQNSFGFRNSDFDISNSNYILNLIDTPGHVDFSYEVSRSLAACEGVILVVDSTQGVQAQTLAYMQQVVKRNLKVIPVINKIDLPIANVSETKEQMKQVFGFNKDEFIEISGKTGKNVDILLSEIINRIPPPSNNSSKPIRMLVFSSIYEPHRGVVCFVKVVDGEFTYNPTSKLRFMVSNNSFVPVETGYFSPKMVPSDSLKTGEVGYVATGLKDIHQAKVGDTLTFSDSKNISPLPGYQEPKPMVFMGLFPVDSDKFSEFREAIEKLNLQDGAFSFRPLNSPALGHGFHCGFLGRLHADIVSERLEREFDMNIIRTLPQVSYILELHSGKQMHIEYAQDFPDPSQIKIIKEPVMQTTIFSPKSFVGSVMKLAASKRGIYIDMKYLGNQVKFEYLIPLSEIILDFFDKIKSITSGYATIDYEFYEYKEVDAVKLDILVHNKKIDALSMIVVKGKAEDIGRQFTIKLKESIPRHNFEIPIQAAIGGKIVAREDIKSYRKDVTEKLYGGDRTRKDKLLDTQKKGKKRMKRFGSVDIPKEAFLEILKSD